MTEMKKPVRLGSPEYQAVYDNILNYFNGDQLAADVLIGKYLHRDNEFLYETSPEDLFNRLTDEFYRIEQKYPNPLSRSEIYGMFKDFKKSVLGGSALSGIGNGGYVSFSNCYVIGNESDSYGGIFKTDEEQTQLHKRRAGVGHDISHLRPANAPVQNSAITSSGGASFMERYSESTRSVAQNGRRGATILTCDISSMIAEDFIDAKTDLSKVTGCNVSIKVNSTFMHAVEHHEMFKQTWVHPTNPAFNMQKDVDASKLFDKIVHNNWLSAEPGLLFWDTVLKWSNQRHYGPEYVEKSVNPCFTGDTLLLTKDGYRTFEELAKEWNFDKQGYHATLLNKDGEQCGGTVWSNGFKHVIKLVFNNKSYIECTPNHKFMLQDGTECEASSLIGKIVKGFDGNDAKCTQIIDDCNIKEVFDFNLNGDCHWGIVGGLIAHNCGELPLSPNQSCILLNLNLTSCVKNPFTKKAEFDFTQLDKNAYALAKLADDFIDLELEAVERIQAKIESDIEPESIKRTEKELWEKIHDKLIKLRKFGIGHMGIADVFAMLGIQYGTQQSIELAAKIQQTIANATYSASIDMAKDRGAFPIFDHDKDKNALFVQKMLEVLPTHYVDLYWKHGRRNVTTCTIPPTGSVSILAQCTSGIENVFMLLSKRRRKQTAMDDDNIVSFIDDKTGDRFIEYLVCHQNFLNWIHSCIVVNPQTGAFDKVDTLYTDKPLTFEQSSQIKNWILSLSNDELTKLIKLSPWCQSTMDKVDWIGKVELQGAVQEWCDASISVTVNLPNNATEALIKDVYMTAWKAGCKGCTIYRDGSRSGVLVSVDNNANNAKASSNSYILANGKRSKRKPVLPAQIYTFRIKGEYWCIFIGIDNGKPYEVFAFKPTEDEFNQLQTMVDNGVTTTITKVKKKVYRLGDNCSFIKAYNDIIRRFDMDEQQTITRLYSTMLRNGVGLDEIVDQTEKSTAALSSFCKAIGRALKTFIAEGTSLYEKCPQCGGDLVKFDGCTRCKNCGFSKCG